MFLDPWWRRASWQRKHLADPVVSTLWQTGSETKRGRKSRIKISQGHPLGGQLPPYRTHLLKFAKSPKNISSSWGPCRPFYSNYCSSHIARKPIYTRVFCFCSVPVMHWLNLQCLSIVNFISFSYTPVMAHRRERRSSKHSFINAICVC